MGKPDFKKKRNVFHLVEFILAVIAAACLTDTDCIYCGNHISRMQLITATAYGVLMLITLIFIGMFIGEELGEKSIRILTATGGVLNVLSGILVLMWVLHSSNSSDSYYEQLLLAGICLAANGMLFLVEFTYLLCAKEKLEENVN